MVGVGRLIDKRKGDGLREDEIDYLLRNDINDRLLRHERKHLEQIERDGRLLFSVKYAWWTLRHGYLDNPYEVEARAAESKTT